MKRLSALITIAGIIVLIGLTATWAQAAGPSASNATLPVGPLCKSLYKKKPVPAKTLKALVRSHELWVEYRG
ncbi:hypothetical protein, partial [Nitrospira sp. BLG_2]|uniref:hypothetical protein n=1 Tax=Nitrospira sp. BLG_2 TaxID=3397507 RepID=UPI003B9D88B3